MERADESVFAAAVEISDRQARAAFLDRACGTDEALRREVESLLAAYDAGTRLEVPAVLADAGDRTETYLPAVEGVGSTVGPYRLMEQIGEGGMGLVFVAEQTAPLRRRVAVKLIKPGMDSRAVLARFEAERQALALMDHPHIARVLDAGTTPTGRPYFVMELVKGARITDHCDANRLTVRERLGLFGQVCRAVQHAHQKGVIHRDLKPSNVLVAVHDVAAAVKVIDFGVAKAVGTSLSDKTIYTRFAQLIGTPLYMSPEQAGESSLDVDTRTDVYSLGVLLYELLTGTTPILPQALRQVGPDEMRRVIREDDPPRPSARVSTLDAAALTTLADANKADSRRLSQQLRGDLDCVVMRCLEKDRERRYDSAAALAADVDRFLTDQPVVARPQSVGYRVRKFIRRNRAKVIGAGVTLGVAALVTPVVIWQAKEAATARDRADEGDRSARLKREETEHLVTHLLGTEVAARRRAKDWGRAEEGLNRGRALLQSVDGSEELQIDIREQLRDVRTAASLRDLSPLHFGINNDFLASSRGDGDYHQTFRAFGIDVEALPAEEAGRLLSARTIRDELAAALVDWAVIVSGGVDHPNRAARVRHLMAVAQATDPDPWRTKIREAVKALDADTLSRLAKSAELDTQPPTTLCLLGMTLREVNRPKEALAVLTRGQRQYPADLALNLELGYSLTVANPPRHDLAVGYFRAAVASAPDAGVAHFALGDGLYFSGNSGEAIAAYRRAGELNPRHLGAFLNLGNTHLDLGQLDEATAAYRKASRINERDPQPHFNLGNALRAGGRLEEAAAEYRHALRLKDEYIPARCNLGLVLAEMGQLDDAVAELRLGLRQNKGWVDLWSALGTTQFKQGNFEDAVASLWEGVRLNGKNSELRRNLGVALYHSCRPDEAAAELREALRLGETDAVVHQYLGMALSSAGKYDDAVAAYKNAISLDPTDRSVHHNLGHTLQKKGDTAASRAAYREAVRLKEEHLKGLSAEKPPDPDKIRSAQSSLAAALQGAGEFDKAEALFHQVLDSAEKRHGKDTVEVADALGDQGDNLIDAKRFSEAEMAFRQSLKLREDKWADGWETFRTTAALGVALLGQKKAAEAEPFLTKGYAGMKERSAKLSPDAHEYLLETAERLADLYEAAGKADLAKEWREKAIRPKR